jgi:hypothetical protein
MTDRGKRVSRHIEGAANMHASQEAFVEVEGEVVQIWITQKSKTT